MYLDLGNFNDGQIVKRARFKKPVSRSTKERALREARELREAQKKARRAARDAARRQRAIERAKRRMIGDKVAKYTEQFLSGQSSVLAIEPAATFAKPSRGERAPSYRPQVIGGLGQAGYAWTYPEAMAYWKDITGRTRQQGEATISPEKAGGIGLLTVGIAAAVLWSVLKRKKR